MGPTLILLHRTHKLCYALILGYAVARLVDALRYTSEGRGFDFRRCHWHNPSGRTMTLGSAQPTHTKRYAASLPQITSTTLKNL